VVSYVEVTTSSQRLLPSPCPDCVWWQTTQGERESRERRLEWMRTLEATWGSVGLVAVEGLETVASIQFAPVRSLARALILPFGPPPDEAVLLFCLRGRVGRPNVESQELLHRTMVLLRRRGVGEVYAYARPLGTHSMSGVRNLFGLEFLEANGFVVAKAAANAYLMRVDLRGLIPALTEAGWSIRRKLGVGAHPSPATFGRS
jgi:hypothetical protein